MPTPISVPCAKEPILAAEGVEMVAARLDVPSSRLAELARRLTDAEHRRAQRLIGPTARRFVATRGLLRELLGARLAVRPSEVELDAVPGEKPSARGPIKFSVSHSADLAVFAFSSGRDVGVDVERLRPIHDLERVAAIALSPHETDRLRELPEGARVETFIACWTRKEAYLKARGRGLLVDPRTVVASLRPDERADVFSVDEATTERRRWWIKMFAPAPGFVGAVCSEVL